jgi:hypothetical protein
VWRGNPPVCIREAICNEVMIMWSIKQFYFKKKRQLTHNAKGTLYTALPVSEVENHILVSSALCRERAAVADDEDSRKRERERILFVGETRTDHGHMHSRISRKHIRKLCGDGKSYRIATSFTERIP